MAIQDVNKKRNCCFLYGDDPVSINVRKNEMLNLYFHGNVPEPAIFDGNGSFEEYKTALGGQSLFQQESAVIIKNPPFLKKAARGKADSAQADFFETLKELSTDVLLIIIWEGKPDKRIKVVKDLMSLCYTEEWGLINPRDATGIMTRMLAEEGKRLDYDGRAYLEEMLSSWENISRPFLQTECDKIVLMCGSRQMVTQKLLEYAMTDYMNQGIFHFIDDLIDRKTEKVLTGIPRVFIDIPSTIKNLGALSAVFRKIKIYHELSRNHFSDAEIQKRMGLRSSWALRNVKNQALKVREEKAEWFLLEIFDYQMKTRQAAQSLDLQDLFIKYCMK